MHGLASVSAERADGNMYTSELTPNDMDIEFDVQLLSTVYPDSISVSLRV